MEKVSKNLALVLLAGVVVGLSACSSKPSPWTQQSSSPWSNRAEEMQAPVEEAPIEAPMAMEEVEPVPMEAAMMVEEPEPVMEPPMEEPMMMEPEMVAEEPMMAAMAGDIRSQPPGYFAVQVCASSNMQNLMSFARKHQLPEQWTAETSVNGKVWYVLLQGVYPSKAEAEAALADVSARLDTKPWIRSVGSLQAVMMQ